MPDNAEPTPKPNANPTQVREPSNTRPPSDPTPQKSPPTQAEGAKEEGREDSDIQGE